MRASECLFMGKSGRAADITEGGTAIPYWMEDRYIAKEYVRMLKTNGAENRMRPQFYEKDYTGELPKE